MSIADASPADHVVAALTVLVELEFPSAQMKRAQLRRSDGQVSGSHWAALRIVVDKVTVQATICVMENAPPDGLAKGLILVGKHGATPRAFTGIGRAVFVIALLLRGKDGQVREMFRNVNKSPKDDETLEVMRFDWLEDIDWQDEDGGEVVS